MEQGQPLYFRSGLRFLWKWISRLAAAFLLFTLLSVLAFKWINPPTTSFMLQRHLSAWWYGAQEYRMQQEWMPWERISPHLKMAVITAEDQRFATHWGIDLSSVQDALQEYERGESLRGASTISQQLAKNLYLTPNRSYLRKGLEAWFALWMELLMGKQRILEIYLNVVEFGEGIYGVEAAAQHFFGVPADRLDRYRSALMATVLPAPHRYDLAHPSPYMYERQAWILRYMNLLGNEQYLEQLD
ncbi:MAG: monofunctional biosynthetic peptidoglycan transglycosylase [Balneolaceae bacterium]|nr:monofunctional biosynthetic peptidoglycan transglycosylase [Balneolaceae bacterium]